VGVRSYDARPMRQPSASGTYGIVASADSLATQAGLDVLRRKGNAVDAAIATNAVLAVVAPHLCGMGGDLFAIVHRPGDTRPEVLVASGRAGSGASVESLRTDGLDAMPMRRDIRSVTVPGCVDGWLALHERYGSMPLPDVLARAIAYAELGFAVSPLLAASSRHAGVAPPFGRVSTGSIVKRQPLADTLRALASVGGGRPAHDRFYGELLGPGLMAFAADQGHDGWFVEEDFAVPLATWTEPLSVDLWGHRVWTVPPSSQGYLTLATAAIAAANDLPPDADDGVWPHLLVEAAKAAGWDRPKVPTARCCSPRRSVAVPRSISTGRRRWPSPVRPATRPISPPSTPMAPQCR
jgi:gamma-glutamyltranspeptidase / glutathione hydrolase